jgi:dihydrolipoamide dehydrogenase
LLAYWYSWYGTSIAAIKTIFDAKTGELLGAHLIGENVSEMISTFAIAKEAELINEDFINTIFPHPSISEMIHESVLNGFGVGVH